MCVEVSFVLADFSQVFLKVLTKAWQIGSTRYTEKSEKFSLQGWIWSSAIETMPSSDGCEKLKEKW